MSMKIEDYVETYLNRGQHSFAAWLDVESERCKIANGKICGKDIYEEQDHPPFGKVKEYAVLKIDITKKKIIYALIGRVACNFYNGEADVWFEIALSCSKEKLEIWKDLNCANS